MSDSAQTKTEQPTPRRLERSREKGQVAYSADLTGGLVMLILSLTMMLLSNWFLDQFQSRLVGLFSLTQHCARSEDIWIVAIQRCLTDTFALTAPFVAVAFVASGTIAALLTGFRITPQAVTWELSKLDPKNGFKKIFSSRSVVRGVTSVLKMAILISIVYAVLSLQDTSTRWSNLTTTYEMAMASWTLILKIAAAVSAAMVLLGLFDFMFQKWKHLQDMMMSRQEIIQERKRTMATLS